MGYTPAANTASTLKVYLGTVGGGSITAGDNHLTGLSFALTSADVGREIHLISAGATPAGMLVTTITAVTSANSCTLLDDASRTMPTAASTVILWRPIPTLSGKHGYKTSLNTRDTFEFAVYSSSDPHVGGIAAPPGHGTPVMLIDDNLGPLFGGSIDHIKTSSEAGTIHALNQCQCVSWDLILYRRVLQGHTYSNQTIGAIFNTIYGDTFTVLDADGIGMSVIDFGPTIASVSTVSYDSVGDWFDNLVGLASSATDTWFWYTDPYRIVHLQRQSGTSQQTAPFNLLDSDGSSGNALNRQGEGVDVVTTREQYLNRSFVGLGQQLSGGYQSDLFTGDGTTQVFYTLFPVGNKPTIYVNGVQDTSVGVFSQDTGKHWYYNNGSTVITQDAGQTPLNSSQHLQVSYQYYQNPTFLASNPTEINRRAAIESGTGYYEQVSSASASVPGSNPSAADGQAQALANVGFYSQIPQRLELKTFKGGLKIGQTIQVQISLIGIPTATTFLIDSVDISVTPENMALWTVTAINGALIAWEWQNGFGGTGAGGSFTGGGAGTSGSAAGTLIDLTISAPTTINPPAVANAGQQLAYIIRQSGTPGAITWGSISGSAFEAPPPIPLFGRSVVQFIGASDGNWYISGMPILGA